VAGGIPDLMKAWVEWTNAHGGINGHPVKLIAEDDAANPATGISAAKSLLSQHPIALVGLDATTEQGWQADVVTAGVPVIGDNLNPTALATQPLWFPTGSTTVGGSLALLLHSAVGLGKPKFASFYCAEFPACAQTTSFYNDLISGTPALKGASIVYKAAVSSSAPSYASQCVAASQARAQTILLGVDAGTGYRIMNDCASQGFSPVPAATGAAVDATWLKASWAQGTQLPEPDFAWFAHSTPAEQEYQDALKQYAPSLLSGVNANQNLSNTWAALEVFKAAMKRVQDKANPTASDVVTALRSLPAGFDTNGLTPPLNYSKSGPNQGVSCWFNVSIKDHQFVVPDNGAYTCPPSS
jgi:branched-chain amino acid transport system substrate-binding protein